MFRTSTFQRNVGPCLAPGKPLECLMNVLIQLGTWIVEANSVIYGRGLGPRVISLNSRNSAFWGPVSPSKEQSIKSEGGLEDPTYSPAGQHLCSRKILDLNGLSPSVHQSPKLETTRIPSRSDWLQKWLVAGVVVEIEVFGCTQRRKNGQDWTMCCL